MYGQASPAASKPFQLSAFGGITGTYTGLNGGRNLGISAGVDVGIRPYFGLTPSAEFRGSYAFDKGSIVGMKNALGGIRLEKQYSRLHPYGDVLFGRGQMDYQNGGYPALSGNFLYATTTSAVLSPGVGAALDLDPQLAVFADVQFQRYGTPVTPSGDVWSRAITFGAIYHFRFEKRGNPGPYYGR